MMKRTHQTMAVFFGISAVLLASLAVGQAPSAFLRIEAATLLMTPQIAMDRAVLFSDVLETGPEGTPRRFDGQSYLPMRLKELGTVWVPEERAPEFKDLAAGQVYEFEGTVGQYSRRYHVLVQGRWTEPAAMEAAAEAGLEETADEPGAEADRDLLLQVLLEDARQSLEELAQANNVTVAQLIESQPDGGQRIVENIVADSMQTQTPGVNRTAQELMVGAVLTLLRTQPSLMQAEEESPLPAEEMAEQAPPATEPPPPDAVEELASLEVAVPESVPDNGEPLADTNTGTGPSDFWDAEPEYPSDTTGADVGLVMAESTAAADVVPSDDAADAGEAPETRMSDGEGGSMSSFVAFGMEDFLGISLDPEPDGGAGEDPAAEQAAAAETAEPVAEAVEVAEAPLPEVIPDGMDAAVLPIEDPADARLPSDGIPGMTELAPMETAEPMAEAEGVAEPALPDAVPDGMEAAALPLENPEEARLPPEELIAMQEPAPAELQEPVAEATEPESGEDWLEALLSVEEEIQPAGEWISAEDSPEAPAPGSGEVESGESAGSPMALDEAARKKAQEEEAALQAAEQAKAAQAAQREELARREEEERRAVAEAQRLATEEKKAAEEALQAEEERRKNEEAVALAQAQAAALAAAPLPEAVELMPESLPADDLEASELPVDLPFGVEVAASEPPPLEEVESMLEAGESMAVPELTEEDAAAQEDARMVEEAGQKEEKQLDQKEARRLAAEEKKAKREAEALRKAEEKKEAEAARAMRREAEKQAKREAAAAKKAAALAKKNASAQPPEDVTSSAAMAAEKPAGGLAAIEEQARQLREESEQRLAELEARKAAAEAVIQAEGQRAAGAAPAPEDGAMADLPESAPAGEDASSEDAVRIAQEMAENARRIARENAERVAQEEAARIEAENRLRKMEQELREMEAKVKQREAERAEIERQRLRAAAAAEQEARLALERSQKAEAARLAREKAEEARRAASETAIRIAEEEAARQAAEERLRQLEQEVRALERGELESISEPPPPADPSELPEWMQPVWF